MKLDKIMDVHFKKSKKAFTLYYLLSGTLIILAFLGESSPTLQRIPFLIGILFLLNLILFAAKWNGENHYTQGEELRRHLMWEMGLGVELNPMQLALFLRDAGLSKDKDKNIDYYEKGSGVGPKRLVEITAESAFFTSDLAGITSKGLLLIILVGVVGTILSLNYFVQNGLSPIEGYKISKIFLTLFGALITGELTSTYFKFEELKSASGRTFQTCHETLSNGQVVEQEKAILIATEYNANLANALPIPGIVYWMRREYLNTSWASQQTQNVP